MSAGSTLPLIASSADHGGARALEQPPQAGSPRRGPRRRRGWRWPVRRQQVLCATVLLVGVAVGGWTVRLGTSLQSRPEKRLLGSWYRWSLPVEVRPDHQYLLAGALGLLAGAWLAMAWLIHASPDLARWTSRASWLWIAPFALGSPFQSRDVYAYAAQGALLQHGLDPYTTGPRALGSHDPLLQAVDPRWRAAGAPYGPLALRLSGLATSVGGHGVGALLVLRVLSLLCVLGSVLLLRREAPEGKAALVTWLALSPLVLVQLVGAVHWEAEMGLLLVVAVVLARRGHVMASVLAGLLASEVKASALVVVLVLGGHAVWRRRWRAVPGLVVAAGLAVVLAVVAYPRDPWGWVANLRGTARSWSAFTPSTTLYLVVNHVVPRLGASLAVCHLLAVLAASAVALRLLRQHRHDVAASAGVLMLAALAALPTVWPWYLAPATSLVLLSRPRFWWWGAGIAVTSSLAALPIASSAAQRSMVAAEAAAVLVWLGVRHRDRISALARWGRSTALAAPGLRR